MGRGTRQQQQGLGKPIIGTTFQGQQLVAVGNTIYHSPNWKTFPDFLSDYLKMIMGSEWGNDELKKPLLDRHTILQWYDKLCSHQKKYLVKSGNVQSTPTIGVVHCYLGLAYNLYLLKHNVELQNRFIERLKDINNFQGAYYELIIANCLIRAGFELELEDEEDESTKHCEFSAVSMKTRKKYWVEAKSRAVVGVLGKTDQNGTRKSDPTCRLSSHLKNALQKPANNERLIFIDVNTSCDDSDDAPEWFDRAESKLRMKEASLLDDHKAYVFVTNLCFHMHLDDQKQHIAVIPYGLGIADFVKVEPLRLSEIYKRKQKHIDAFDVLDSFKSYPKLPDTFDGSLNSEAFDKNTQRLIIGEKYFFDDLGDNGLIATVTTATVNEEEKKIYIGTDVGYVLTKPMSDNELNDYKNHPDTFFGVVYRQGGKSENEFEFYEHMVETHMSYSRQSTLEKMENSTDYERLKNLSKKDLVLEYCERMVNMIKDMNKK